MKSILPFLLLLLAVGIAESQDHGGGDMGPPPPILKIKDVYCKDVGFDGLYFIKGDGVTVYLRDGTRISERYFRSDIEKGTITLVRVTARGHIYWRCLLKNVAAIKENTLLGKRKFFHKNTNQIAFRSARRWDCRYKIGQFGYFTHHSDLTFTIAGGRQLSGNLSGITVLKNCKHGDRCGAVATLRNFQQDAFSIIKDDTSYVMIRDIACVKWFERKL